MNQDIIDYLDGYWEKHPLITGLGFYFENNTTSGVMTYYPVNNSLYLGEDRDGYEVQIQDLTHLIQLEALL